MRWGLGVEAGQRKPVTRPVAQHLGDYPTGERGERKKEGKKERERAAQRGSENENNIPAPPDFFTL